VLAAVFAGYGGYETPQTYVDGLTPAIWIGAIVVGVGALAALAIPRHRRQKAEAGEQRKVLAAAAAS
jgi:multisubunit Na+/H+ antiporter MnhC subunit